MLARADQDDRDDAAAAGELGDFTAPSTARLSAHERLEWKRRQRIHTLLVTHALLAVPDSPLRQGYQQTLDCGTTVIREEAGVRFTSACGQRWCLCCQGTRIMKWRMKYADEIKSWKEIWHVVLTVPSVTRSQLRPKITEMQLAARKIANNIRRTDLFEFKALRKLEITYNRRRGASGYHPHFHFIVSGEVAARALKKRWLAHFGESWKGAQYVERVDHDRALREIFKYAAKAVASKRRVDGTRDEDEKGRVGYEGIPAWALDAIFQSLRGLRTYQPLGFKAAPIDEESPMENALVEDGSLPDAGRPTSAWIWSSRRLDWVDSADWLANEVIDNGRALIGREVGGAYLRRLIVTEDQIWDGQRAPPGSPDRLVAKSDEYRASMRRWRLATMFETNRGTLRGTSMRFRVRIVEHARDERGRIASSRIVDEYCEHYWEAIDVKVRAQRSRHRAELDAVSWNEWHNREGETL